MKPLVTLREALAHEALLGNALAGPSWLAARVVLIAAMGERLEPEELSTFQRLTGRSRPPSRPVTELAAIIGRRGGKTRFLALLSVYIAALCDHSQVLASGERGIVLLLSPTQRQARIALDYCEGIMRDSPELSGLIVGRTADGLSLSNGIDIEVRAASFRHLRGVTCVAVLADEAAFFIDEASGSANPDTEILNSVRPSLATTGGPLLIASSPYRKAGVLWDSYREFYGIDSDDVLIIKGTSREFNPCLPQSVVDRALARDPAAARAEYLAEWRSDIESYISRETVEACVEPGVRERAPGNHAYRAFVDAAGGSGSDSMTLCIAHLETDIVVIDAVREVRPPFSPNAVVSDFANLLRTYRVREVTGDRFGGEFPRELFRQHGINYRLAELNKSEIYIESLPRLNSRTVRLLDNDRLISQIASLERRHGRTGRDTVDHPPRGHDDVSNSVAGACVIASVPKMAPMVGFYGMGGPVTWLNSEPKPRSWRRRTYDENGNEISAPRYA
jgi:hypothetical protein